VKPDAREITVRLKPDTTSYELSSVTVVVSAFPARGARGRQADRFTESREDPNP